MNAHLSFEFKICFDLKSFLIHLFMIVEGKNYFLIFFYTRHFFLSLRTLLFNFFNVGLLVVKAIINFCYCIDFFQYSIFHNQRGCQFIKLYEFAPNT